VEWLDHPADDDYWAARRPDLGAIDVPVFTVLGYFDDFSSGTARLFETLGAEGVCGPWAHMPWGSRHSGAELGPSAGPGVVGEALLAFFDRVFGRCEGGPPESRVRYHRIGDGWCSAPGWPPPHTWERWTATGGNANSRHGDGTLAPGDTHAGEPDVLVVEPLVPYPGDPLAFQDESASEDRRDVLCYTSAPLAEDLDLAGSPVVTIAASCDRPHHDLVATLALVAENGEARALTGSAMRCHGCEPLHPADHVVTLRPIAVRCPAGTRLRLDVSGARFPAFDRNPHSGVPPAQAHPDETVVATVVVHRAGLDLPIDDGSGDRPQSGG
jgi:putative CocE/NonD family hydrolase